MSASYYQRSLEKNPGLREIMAARSKRWRAEKLAKDPGYLKQENVNKRRAEKLRGDSRHRYDRNLMANLVIRARRRGRQSGLEATIKRADIFWPTHCPVLGTELDYSTPKGKRAVQAANLPSLDRWDNSKGYVPGNVYVISLRANQLKGNATADELEAIARYARHGAVR